MQVPAVIKMRLRDALLDDLGDALVIKGAGAVGFGGEALGSIARFKIDRGLRHENFLWGG
jgi:hypothetical protein